MAVLKRMPLYALIFLHVCTWCVKSTKIPCLKHFFFKKINKLAFSIFWRRKYLQKFVFCFLRYDGENHPKNSTSKNTKTEKSSCTFCNTLPTFWELSESFYCSSSAYFFVLIAVGSFFGKQEPMQTEKVHLTRSWPEKLGCRKRVGPRWICNGKFN